MRPEDERQAILDRWRKHLPPGLHEALVESQRRLDRAHRKTRILETWENTGSGRRLIERRRVTTGHGWKIVKVENLPLTDPESA